MASKPVVVLDTNVFVSGLLSPNGAPGAILQLLLQGDFEIVTSQAQIREIRQVLKRPSLIRALPKGTPKEVLRFLASFKKLTRILKPKKLTWDFKDLNDHFLLDLAVFSKADFLVTGDKALQSLRRVGRCDVISVAHFLETLGVPTDR